MYLVIDLQKGMVTMDTLNYVALSHQKALRRQLDLVANNIANMNTAGYKRENAIFETYLEKMDSSLTDSAKPVSFVLDQGFAHDTTAGDLIPTNEPTDVALVGEGYFTIRTEDGQIAYTRNGNFRISDEGYLVTDSGAQVMSDGEQPIQFTPQETDFHIASDGTVSSNLGPRGRLLVTAFESEVQMKKIGASMMTGEGGKALPPEEVKLKSGVIEGSNVKPVIELADMIEILRAYQSTTRLLDKYDDIRQRGIEKLGRVQ